MDNLYFSQRATNIYRALRKAIDEMFQSENGMRSNSSKMMILITDGQTEDSQYSDFRTEFQINNITLVVVGVGNVNITSLRKLVINDKDLFIAENFDDLIERLTSDVAHTICAGIFLVTIIQIIMANYFFMFPIFYCYY